MVRLDELEADGLADVVVAPRDTLLAMLGVFTETGLSPALVVQFWGEAMVDAELKAEMSRTAAKLGHALDDRGAPLGSDPHGILSRGRRDSPSRPARTLTALAQGYMANSAVFGRRDPAEYVESAASILSDVIVGRVRQRRCGPGAARAVRGAGAACAGRARRRSRPPL